MSDNRQGWFAAHRGPIKAAVRPEEVRHIIDPDSPLTSAKRDSIIEEVKEVRSMTQVPVYKRVNAYKFPSITHRLPRVEEVVGVNSFRH